MEKLRADMYEVLSDLDTTVLRQLMKKRLNKEMYVIDDNYRTILENITAGDFPLTGKQRDILIYGIIYSGKIEQ